MSNSPHFKVLETPQSLQINNGIVGVQFQRPTAAVAWRLAGITDAQKGVAFRFADGEANCLWETQWRDRQAFRATLTGATPCNFDHEIVIGDAGEQLTLILRWQSLSLRLARYGNRDIADRLEPLGSDDSVDVEVRLTFARDAAALRWSWQARHKGSDHTLWQVVFPKVQGLHREAADNTQVHMTLPVDWGWYMPLHERKPLRWSATYPSHRCCMQFMAYHSGEAGLYWGWHDPTAQPKTFAATAKSTAVDLAIDHLPADMTRVQEQIHLTELVTQVFSGDWYDAAQLYRLWALQQPWTNQGLVKQRRDIPEWLKETVMWWCLSSGKDTGTLSVGREVPVEEVGDTALALRKRFPYPSAVHWYNWHQIPFNTSFPDYLPAKEGFAEQVKRLAAADVKVMPYINARLADPNSRAWQEDDAARFCARKASPRCEPAHYPMLFEQYANQQYLVPMCSATQYWQDKIAAVVAAMQEELGVAAIYLDQVACGAPPVCFAPEHGHSLGGGDYGVKGYNEMLAKIQARRNDNEEPLVLTTESNAEPFMAGIPAYLMWMPCPQQQVPLFAAVYSGYVITFGRAFYDGDLQDPFACAAKIAQMFLWGCQLGWIRNSVAEQLLLPAYAAEAAFLASVCHAFARGRQYLVEGHMCRPPQQITAVESVAMKWQYRPEQAHPVRLPGIMATLWRHVTGERVLAIANILERPGEVTYRVEMPAAMQIVAEDLSEVGARVEVQARRAEWAEITVSVPARSAAIIKLGSV